MRRPWTTAVSVLVGAAGLVAAGLVAAGPAAVAVIPEHTTVRVSAPGGGQANGGSFADEVAGGGRYVAFGTLASDMVPGDLNGSSDIVVADLDTGALERVSLTVSGAEIAGPSAQPSISADGRYVAFRTGDSNVVAGDTNGANDVFVRDRQLGTTTRVSENAMGVVGDDHSMAPSISDDGRFVAFRSTAGNLTGDPVAPGVNLYLKDLQTGVVSLVSRNAPAFANDQSGGVVLAGEGRYVAFDTQATNLAIDEEDNDADDVFLHDRTTGTSRLVSVGMDGTTADGDSSVADVSPDGRYVVFGSSAPDLVPGDTNEAFDIFVRDMTAGTTTRVSVNSSGVEGSSRSDRGSISADGRYVVFLTTATELGPGSASLEERVVMRRDLRLGVTEVVSDAASSDAGVSDDGQTVVFSTADADVVDADTNGESDVFASRLAPPATGYWLLEGDGDVHAFGEVDDLGGVGASLAPGATAVAMAAHPTGHGYWVLASDGELIPRGVAADFGAVNTGQLSKPGEAVSGLAVTGSGTGLWATTTAGRVIAFGSAPPGDELANTDVILGLDLDGPVLDAEATPTGAGLYLVASDGGVFTVGDSVFIESVRGVLTTLHGPPGLPDQPVTGITADPDGHGYWMVALDGGVFSFDAPFRGSLPALVPFEQLVAPVAGMVPFGSGYLLFASDGGVFDFSPDRDFAGSAAGIADAPVVDVAAAG